MAPHTFVLFFKELKDSLMHIRSFYGLEKGKKIVSFRVDNVVLSDTFGTLGHRSLNA